MKSETRWIPVAVALSVMTFVTHTNALPPDHAGGGPKAIVDCQVIDESGAYFIDNNLPNPDGGSLLAGGEGGGVALAGDCLVVTVDGVTIDGANFVITGDYPTNAGNGAGIRSASGLFGVAISNLMVQDFYDGILLPNSFAAAIAYVTARGNEHHGIDIVGNAPGQHGKVTNNAAIGNNGTGIRLGANSIATNNSTSGNERGIFSGDSSIVATGNVADGNVLQGLSFTCPSVVVGNVATDNGSTDIALSGGGCVDENNAVTAP